MTEILNFRRSERGYIEQSEYWSKKGDSFKSLLYARHACECGGISARLRLASALYETGNYARSVEIYLRFIGEGHATPEIYAGLIKCLTEMSRYRSAAYFIRDAKSRGILKLRGDKLTGRADFNKMLSELRRQFPDLKRDYDTAEDDEFKRLLYVVRRGDFSLDETLLPDLYIGENDAAASDILFKAASIITPDKLNRQLAGKLLAACEESLVSEFPRQDLLATKIVSLITLGRTEEAEMTAEDLMSLELPDNDADLLKCAVAMIAVEYHDGAVDYLEELTNDVFEENLVYQNAVANLNAGDKERAKELFSEVLVINPHNVAAKYWCDYLVHAEAVAEYDMSLPNAAEIEARGRIDEMLTAAGDYDDGVEIPEHREMDDLLAYELRGEDGDYAVYLGRGLALFGFYRGVVNGYLLDPEGWLSVKREIIADLLTQDYKTPVTAFLFGIKRISVMRDFESMGCPEELVRAYVNAFAAFAVFNGDYGGLDEIFDKMYDYLSALNFSRIQQAENVASILVLYGGLAEATTPKEAAALFGTAETRVVIRMCDEVEARYADVRRPKKNARKR